jgi:hypothetical protein
MHANHPLTWSVRLTAGVHFHLLGREAILFCQQSRQLYYLNTTATYIWCCLEEGLEPSNIARLLSSQFGVPPTLASEHLSETLASWAYEGLFSLDNNSASSETVPPHAIGSRHAAALTQCHLRTQAKPAPKRQGGGIIRQPFVCSASIDLNKKIGKIHRYRLGGVMFTILYTSDRALSSVHPAIAHLQTAQPIESNVVCINFRIAEENGFALLFCDREKQYGHLDFRELVPLIQQLVMKRAYEASGCLAAFHAGAIADKRGTIVLPGAPGGGKSTLIAALTARGLTYLTDELVLLMPGGGIRPLPVSLGLKSGAWALLSQDIPTLTDLPIHLQQDGTEVRYFLPSGRPPPEEQSPPLRALVFPEYVAGAPTRLAPLSTARAFARIAEAGYAVPGEPTPPVVAALIGWLDSQVCYELKVGDLDSAVTTMAELLM